VLEHEIDVISNNVANSDTTGFKVEALTVQTDPERTMVDPTSPLLSTVNFPLDTGVVRDFSQGDLKATGGALNLAIQGQGFFRISTTNGERYTRDGAFTLDAQGRIVTADGDPVQGDGGAITLDPLKGQPSISADGTVSQQGQIVGKVSLVNFATLSALTKQGNGLYSNDTNLQPQPVTSQIRQGMLEQSNVQPILQITRLIQVSRAYEHVSQMMDQTSQLSSSAVDRLGKVSTN
jgi:flagellar basal-body rod protein FlgF